MMRLKKRREKIDNRLGTVLVLALAVLTLVSMLAIVFFASTETTAIIARDNVNNVRAENLATSGMELAKAELRATYRLAGSTSKGLFAEMVGIDPTYTVPGEITPTSTSGRSKVYLDSRHPGSILFIDWDGLSTPGFSDMTKARFYLKQSGINPDFSMGEPFSDSGYAPVAGGSLLGANDGMFSYEDVNHNGLHDPGEPCEPFTDLNNNGAWDNYTAAVRFAVDDYWGTMSLSMQDTSSMIYVNGGIVPGDPWRTWLSSRPLERMLDNLGVILGLFDEDETFERYDDYYDDYSTLSRIYRNRYSRPSQVWMKRKPHGKSLGRLILYGDADLEIAGRPAAGFKSKTEVIALLAEFARKQPERLITQAQLDLLEELLTTEAWIDPHTVTAGRWLYPEEHGIREGALRWDYPRADSHNYSNTWTYYTANLVGELVQGRADDDAEPRWYWNAALDDYVKAFNDARANSSFAGTDDPNLKFSIGWYYNWDGSRQSIQTDRQGNEFLLPESGYDWEAGDKDDDLDDIMGWVAEPRAPVNINAASQPVLEAVLAGLTATYVTDRENNLYPNKSSVSDVRRGVEIIVGVPAYNFYFDDTVWGIYEGANFAKNLPVQTGWFDWASGTEYINFILQRVNPTIRGYATDRYNPSDGTPAVTILPKEARALAAAIIEYRNGSESFHDLNGNGILDFGDDSDADGLLRPGVEWTDANGDGRFQGGTLKSWEQFFVFLNMIKYNVFDNTYKLEYWTQNKLLSRVTNLFDLKADLVFANCCPNTDVLLFNPNASWAALNRSIPPNAVRLWDGRTNGIPQSYADRLPYLKTALKRNVTKGDLFDEEGNPTHTTEFTLQPTGRFQIESTGRVLSASGVIEAEKKLRCVVRSFDKITLTTQADFEIGPDDTGTYDTMDGLQQKIASGGNKATKNRIVTMPEADWKRTGLDGNPWKTGWQVNVAQAYVPEGLHDWFKDRNVVPSYDGQLRLDTRYTTDAEMAQTLSTLARYQLRTYVPISHYPIPNSGNARVDYRPDDLNMLIGGTTVHSVTSSHLRRDDIAPDDYAYDKARLGTPGAVRFPSSPDYPKPFLAGWPLNSSSHWSAANDGVIEYRGQYGDTSAWGDESNPYFCLKRLFEPDAFPLCGPPSYYVWVIAYPGDFPGYAGYYGQVRPFNYKDSGVNSMPNNSTYLNAELYYPMTTPKFDLEPRFLPDGFYRTGMLNLKSTPSGACYVRSGWELPNQGTQPRGGSPAYDPFNRRATTSTSTPKLDKNGNQMYDKNGNLLYDYSAFAEGYSQEDADGIMDYWHTMTPTIFTGNSSIALSFVVEFWWKPMYTLSRNDNTVWDANQEDFMKAQHTLRIPPWNPDSHPSASGVTWQQLVEFRTQLPYYYLYNEGGINWNDQTLNLSTTRTNSTFSLWHILHPLMPQMNSSMYSSEPVLPPSFHPNRELCLDLSNYGASYPYNTTGQGRAVPTFRYRDEPDFWTGSDPLGMVDYRRGTSHNFKEGEWVHLAISAGPNEVRLYINGQIPYGYTLFSRVPAEFTINTTPINILTPLLLQSIILSHEISGTLDDLRFYTLGPGTTLQQAENELIRIHYAQGRYYPSGSWTSPTLKLPENAQIIHINWTEHIPAGLDTSLVNLSTGERLTDVIVALLTKDGAIARDSNGSVILYQPANDRNLGVDISDPADFGGKFKVRVDIQGRGKSTPKDPNAALLDTPVVDDITILYSTGEEILLWEIVE